MGMLRDALWQLVVSLLTLVQLAVASVLLGYVYTPILIVVGVLNLLYHLVTGSNFDNIELLYEPLMWYFHQLQVLFAVKDDFRAAPYLS